MHIDDITCLPVKCRGLSFKTCFTVPGQFLCDFADKYAFLAFYLQVFFCKGVFKEVHTVANDGPTSTRTLNMSDDVLFHQFDDKA